MTAVLEKALFGTKLDLSDVKPFLKWVGGKRQLAPALMATIRAILPWASWRGHYYEPFFGGGALFFAMRAAPWKGNATLGDSNELLVRAYLGVRNDVEAVISALKSGYRYDEEEYYRERARYSLMKDKDDQEAAAWLIYMNRTGFNGLYRVSKKGNYNVPFGKYTNPTICDADGLRRASLALARTKFLIGDFERIVKSAEKGDLAYFDPPYVPASATSNFTSYTSDGFTFEDQQRLRDCADRLKQRGVHVILSNSDTEAVRGLYRHFNIQRVEARRSVNSKGKGRGPVGEVIIT